MMSQEVVTKPDRLAQFSSAHIDGHSHYGEANTEGEGSYGNNPHQRDAIKTSEGLAAQIVPH